MDCTTPRRLLPISIADMSTHVNSYLTVNSKHRLALAAALFAQVSECSGSYSSCSRLTTSGASHDAVLVSLSHLFSRVDAHRGRPSANACDKQISLTRPETTPDSQKSNSCRPSTSSYHWTPVRTRINLIPHKLPSVGLSESTT